MTKTHHFLLSLPVVRREELEEGYMEAGRGGYFIATEVCAMLESRPDALIECIAALKDAPAISIHILDFSARALGSVFALYPTQTTRRVGADRKRAGWVLVPLLTGERPLTHLAFIMIVGLKIVNDFNEYEV